MNWYKLTSAETADHLNTEAARGLSAIEAQQRLAQHGANELIERGTKSPWKILWEQFTATMVLG